MRIKIAVLSITLIVGLSLYSSATTAFADGLNDPYTSEYVIAQDTIPIEDRTGDYINNPNRNPFDLRDPSVIEQEVEYDPETGNYIITERIGEDYYRAPTYMTFEEYLQWRSQQEESNYFDRLNGVAGAGEGGSVFDDPIEAIDVKNSIVDRLFGGSEVTIRPQGNIDLTFGMDFQRTANPALPLRQQRNGGFDFDMDIQMSVDGSIGEKLKLGTSYNTQATFDFENQLKLEYDSENFGEDDIVKNIDAGNISFPLNNSLIKGSQSLFGIRTDLQFGRLKLSLVASQQQSQQQSIDLQGGDQLQYFEVRADEYEENRHFFFTHYNRKVFSESLRNLPQINNLFRVTKLEVYVTNSRNETQGGIRDILAFTDLGEPEVITSKNVVLPPVPAHRDIFQRALPGREITNGPAAYANNLLERLQADENIRDINKALAILTGPRFRMQQNRDFEKVQARKLSPSEYSFHPELGILSINAPIQPTDVIAVSLEYDYNGKTYKIGEFGNDVYDPDSSASIIYTKLLKSTTQQVSAPTWDLMLKNVYNIGAFQVDRKDFLLDIYYSDPGGGEKRFLPATNLEGRPLLQVFNLDNLNAQGDPCPDGRFDYVPGVTIQPRNGRIMFPVLEPFGSDLQEQIDDPNLAEQFTFQALYDTTVTAAREVTEKNRFIIRGSYKSGGAGGPGGGVNLRSFNLPRGGVRVIAGGQELVEGVDYTVDYNTGNVTVSEAIRNSGLNYRVEYEDNSLFGFQQKTLLGVRADFELNKKTNIGATWMHLFERPFTQKVNVGEDPISNGIFGLDLNYSSDAPWLTKLVDKIPGIDTKEPSSMTLTAEAAISRPGHANAINIGKTRDGKTDKSGALYLDDFEGSTSGFDLRVPNNRWVLASVPQNDAENNNPLFPEASLINDLDGGVNRAQLSWYRIDQSVNNTSNPYEAIIPIQEVFPNQQVQPGFNSILQTFDLTFNPRERGPYNFDLPGGTPYSSGLDPTSGRLVDPETRWGGIMRALTTTDFQAANIEFLEFWVLNPFMNNDNPGDLYINLGNISEDILRDSRLFFENGIPVNPTQAQLDELDKTEWSRIPNTPNIARAFDNENRSQQDVGYDGTGSRDGNQDEFEQYRDVMDIYQQMLPPSVYNQIAQDPANDDFESFNSDFYPDGTPTLERYSKFNNPEGNSPEATQSGGISFAQTTLPENEDIDADNTLNESESYYQYKIPLRSVPSNVSGNAYELDVDNTPFVTDRITSPSTNRTWYRFKVPVEEFTSRVGAIEDFRTIRFIRMYLNGFEQQVTLRFARLELARNQWRRYQRPLLVFPEPIILPAPDRTLFDVNDVNIEENGARLPFNYVLPPDIQREQANNTVQANLLQNEQSLALEVCNLEKGDARGIYKFFRQDLRFYKRIKMFVHGEMKEEDQSLEDEDLAIFMRIGSDLEQNYYEYEMPLQLSDPDGASPTGNLQAYQRVVWPIANEFDISLDELKDLKAARNAAGISFQNIYEEDVEDGLSPGRKVRVRGNPSVGDVRAIMIGIVNRDEIPHCAEVWVNELRVTGLKEEGGVAAIARADFKLADFGDLRLSGEVRTDGYRALEEKIFQQRLDDLYQYDVSTNLELSKFLPEDSGLSIPFYFQHSKSIIRPKFDPFDLDVPLDEKIDAQTTAADRDSVREQAQTVSSTTSFNFTNVRKNRTNTDKAPMPWNIENFSASYSFTEADKRDPFIASDNTKTHNGSLDYTYSTKGANISPFKKLFKKDKYVKLISDFNFNPLPNSFAFSTNMRREKQTTEYRFTDLQPEFRTFFNKQFSWDRSYDLRWDLSRSLKFNFSANNQAVIDELKNFDENNQPRTQEELRAEIWKNIKDFGRTKTYQHDVGLNWRVPIDKLPFLDWVDAKAQYDGAYSWATTALNLVDSLGNVIQNSQTRQVSGNLNFEKLYNKSKFLAKINKPRRKKTSRRGARSGRRGGRGAANDAKDKNAKDNPKTDDGKEEEADKKDKKKKRKDGEPSVAARVLLRPLMMLRKARFTYSQEFSTVIPGFMPQTQMLGLSEGFDAPGWDFVAGWQPDIAMMDGQNDWLDQAARKGWMSETVFLNQQVLQNYSENISGRATIEPLPGLRIELEANRRYSENLSLYFKDTLFDQIEGNYEDLVHLIPREIGSFQMSYFSLGTLFKDGTEDLIALFDEFEDNRVIISQRLGGGEHSQDGPQFSEGYGKTQQDVILPAFFAAYNGDDANTVDIDQNYTNVLFKLIPKVNWRVNYDGLSKMEIFKEIFSRFEISHGYQSSLTVNSYATDRDFVPSNPDLLTTEGNFYSRFEIPDIVIDERFSPLLGVNVELKNQMNFKLDYNQSRNLAFNLLDYRLNESRAKEFVIGFGYTIEDIDIAFLTGSRKKSGSRKRRRGRGKDEDDDSGKKKKTREGSNLKFQFDLSYRDDVTLVQIMDQDLAKPEPTRGTETLRISPSIDYNINDRVTLRFFVDYSKTKPKLSNQFDITTTQGGITVRFTLK